MNSKHSALKTRLSQFLDGIPFDDIAAQVSARSDKQASDISVLLNTYANECHVSLDLVIDHLDPAERILEVGAGLCLLSLFLKQEGFQMTALEPALGGFGFIHQLQDAVIKHFPRLELKVIKEPAHLLNPLQHGSFELIFSNNVMEHIPDWPSALQAMSAVLSAGGKMLHACPNYTVPYEPHYGVPVFRHFPALSKRMFLSGNVDGDIWDSLNFITCRDVKKFCNNHNLVCCFERELLYKSLQRIEHDPLFEKRHQGLVTHAARLVMRSGLGGLLKTIPPALSTPMIMQLSRPVNGGSC